MKPISRFLLPVVLAVTAGLFPPEFLIAQERTVTITGNVTDAETGRAVPAVSIIYHGAVVARTENNGRFRVDLVGTADSSFAIGFERMGYAAAIRTVVVLPGQATVELSAELVPVPTALEEIVVEGQRIVIRNPGLVGFYNRRAENYGRFMVEEEIERRKGFDLTPYLRWLRVPSGCPDQMPLVVYLDGTRVPDLETVNRLIPPNQLAGIESYVDERKSRLPREFVPAGPHCGVVMFWTRDPKPPSRGTIGLLVSVPVSDWWKRSTLLGAQLVFPLKGGESTLEFRGILMVAVNDRLEKWRAVGDVAFRPLAEWWYIGTGVTVAKESIAGSISGSELRTQHSIVSGFEFNFPMFRPFFEVHAMHSFTGRSLHLGVASGVSVTFGN